MSSIKLATLHIGKTSGETKRINFEFEAELSSSETLSSVIPAISPSGGSHASVQSSSVSGSQAQIVLTGGMANVSFTGDDSTDTLTAASHGLSDGETVRVLADNADNLPGGLDTTETYYVISSDTNTLQLSLTSGGSAVSLTSDGQGELHVEYLVTATVVTSTGQTFVGKGKLLLRD